ncbi:aminopeptidase P family protein [Brevibacillus agri]|uniref:M24 family metallopeptidase n=1 Tax=Brevibacillus agri TaxID=51101 RepID=UPI001C8D36A2|nr:aminopeptidase P family protein [Brevibacillus agri]MBY0054363.1 aminopeptidase P family protein [Brevibacillus agri]
MPEARRQRLSRYLQQENTDACIVVPGPNLYYFTGLALKPSERLSFAVLTKENRLLFVVPRVELSKVEKLAHDDLFWYTDEQGPDQALAALRQKLGTLGRLGIEEGQMRVKELKAAEMLGAKELVAIDKTVDKLRVVKDEREIAALRQAVRIVEESFTAVLPAIREGVAELEIAAELEYEMRKRGSEGTPFGTIVASGYRGALPHGRAADKLIRSGELVVLDFGAYCQGYVADITRTVAVGEPAPELARIYEIVRQAQQAAVDAVRPGVTAHEIDETARAIIRDSGYGEFFTHRLGHGIGLSGHEEPYMHKQNPLRLEPGMAFTIEPGIYLPDKGGVRIEDNVVVTEDGCLNLMTLSKQLLQL